MSVVVLLSGGLDSVVLATVARQAGDLAAAVFVDYGQPAVEQERRASALWCGRNKTRLVALAGAVPAVGVLAAGVGAAGPRVVPCRNLILLSLAAGVAAELGASEIWYGATAGDQAAYPDCRPEFAAALSDVLGLEVGISVHMPLSGMRRSDVLALARALDIDVSETWSCYQPTAGGQPCGACNSCRQGM